MSKFYECTYCGKTVPHGNHTCRPKPTPPQTAPEIIERDSLQHVGGAEELACDFADRLWNKTTSAHEFEAARLGYLAGYRAAESRSPGSMESMMWQAEMNDLRSQLSACEKERDEAREALERISQYDLEQSAKAIGGETYFSGFHKQKEIARVALSPVGEKERDAITPEIPGN